MRSGGLLAAPGAGSHLRALCECDSTRLTASTPRSPAEGSFRPGQRTAAFSGKQMGWRALEINGLTAACEARLGGRGLGHPNLPRGFSLVSPLASMHSLALRKTLGARTPLGPLGLSEESLLPRSLHQSLGRKVRVRGVASRSFWGGRSPPPHFQTERRWGGGWQKMINSTNCAQGCWIQCL